MLQSYLSLSSRKKIYLILVFASLILLFYSIWQVKPVIVEADDALGLVSCLTPCYWIGLAFLLLTSILVFLDRELKKDAIFLTILFALGLFLIVLPAFIYEYPTENTNFYPFSEIINWLPTHRLDISNPPHFASYYSWPSFHFISASIVGITKVDFLGFAKYVPIFFLLCFVFTTYAIGKRIKLEPNRCFLLAFLALSSYLLITVDYAPRTLGMMLFLLLFMLLLTPRRTVAETILAILLFSAIVLTHPLTTLAVLPALILLSIYRRKQSLVILFIVIFGTWYIYQAFYAMEFGIQQALTQPMSQLFMLTQQETPLRQVSQVSMARIFTRYSWIIYGIFYVALMIGSIILLLRQRITGERRKQVISAFCWSIGSVLVMVATGFTDAFQRIYIFCLVPAAVIIVLSFSSRKVTTSLMIVLMCLFVALHMPADYSDEVAWGQLTATEVKGSEFFALEVKPEESYYYDGNPVMLLYYDPSLITAPEQRTSRTAWGMKSPDEVDLSDLDESRYVIISKHASDKWLFSWRQDPTTAWCQTDVGKKADLIYNNGYFQVYKNHLAE